ncbi:response regulator transcription factor [Leifsonia poae]|uniref:helix-turn-helix transcriptional regulator n=1 Tax=Leifsonia poae TaxID=110933 RepID=UPI003D6646AA
MGESVAYATKQGGFDVGFGGLVDTENAKLSAFAHTIGQSIHGLLIQPGEGLGGRVMTTRAPGVTVDYLRSNTITHRYEREVAAEHMVSIAAVPVVVRERVRAILYGGFRAPTHVGSESLDALVTAAQRMKWEMTVRDEVERRLDEIFAENEMIAAGNTSGRQTLADRQEFAQLRVATRTGEHAAAGRRYDQIAASLIELRSADSEVHLTARELDVLAHVALGMRNARVAELLHLRETTVKAYVSSAMRKLGAGTRYEAVLRAKAAGFIP